MTEFRASPAIVAELDEAIEWYARRSPEAARRFIAAVEAAIDSICENPRRFPWRSSRYQYARV
jgi:plasmid stabilization system protein ParE